MVTARNSEPSLNSHNRRLATPVRRNSGKRFLQQPNTTSRLVLERTIYRGRVGKYLSWKIVDDLQQNDPNDPELGNLANEIKMAHNKTARDKWCESLGRRTNLKRFWQVLRNLSGKRTFTLPNQPIKLKAVRNCLMIPISSITGPPHSILTSPLQNQLSRYSRLRHTSTVIILKSLSATASFRLHNI